MMCKAKERIQQAHGYQPTLIHPFPKPGTTIGILDNKDVYDQGELISATAIGLRVRVSGLEYFMPWAAVNKLSWEDPKDNDSAAANQQSADDSPGPEH